MLERQSIEQLHVARKEKEKVNLIRYITDLV